MTDQTLEQAFREAVLASFAFLTSELGFSLSRQRDYLIEFESRHCRIRLYLESDGIVVSVQPTSIGEATALDNPPNELGLEVIVGCLDPKSGFQFKHSGLRPQEVRGETDRLALALRKYCTPIMNGDFANWPRLERCAKEIVKAWKQETKSRTEERRLDQVRAKAEIAWREKNFAELVALYESVQQSLTRSELKKLEYAKSRLAHH